MTALPGGGNVDKSNTVPTFIEGQPLAGKGVLIVVENLPLPFDRRVWQEARTLRAAGAEVSVICPKGKGYEKSHERIDGVHGTLTCEREQIRAV